MLTRWKKSSSAVLNSSEMTGVSLLQKPNRLLRRNNESRRTWSAEHIQGHDGAAYRMREMTVARKMSCSDVLGVPCERSTRIAYSMLDPYDSSAVT